MNTTDTFDEIPSTIKPISTRQAAQILNCGQRHIRQLVEPWLARSCVNGRSSPTRRRWLQNAKPGIDP